MHINNWVHASDLMKMIKSANSTSTLSSEEGLPDNHVITIRERELTVDFPELIQNNIKTDTVALDLDSEWDGIQPVIIFGPNASGTIAVEYTGEPVHIPGAVMQYVGGLDCSVMGLDDSGEVRLVTKAAPNTFEVVESGEYIGQISEDDVSLLGQILSAIKDVETATSDASSAAEAAAAAANSANTAATKATNAANSANTAATKATNAANSANTASERAENAYDALTPIIAEIGANGNQPRATTNPNRIATASDAYAAKPLEICIKGATRQNLWANPSGVIRGVAVTANADGSITVEGTATQRVTINLESYALRAGSRYTASSDKKMSDSWIAGQAGSGAGFGVICRDSSGANQGQTLFGYGDELTKSFDVASTTAYVSFYVIVEEGVTVSGTYRVMLNEGSTAEPWCPPGLSSVDELSLVTAGKNLLDGTGYFEGAYSFGYATAFRDPDLRTPAIFPYTTTAPYRGIQAFFYAVAGETYTFSQANAPDGAILKYQQFWGGKDTVSADESGYTGCAASTVITGPVTFKYSGLVVVLSCLNSNATGITWLEDFGIQVEVGSTATVYEPPQVTTTPIDLDGHALNSLPDGTCDELTIDATGAVTLVQRVGQVTVDSDDLPTNYATNTAHASISGSVLSPDSAANSYWLRDEAAMGDVLPVADAIFNKNYIGFSGTSGDGSRLYVNAPASSATDYDGARTWLNSNPLTVLYKLAEPQTIPLSPVTLPTLPSPNITVYHDSDVPSDITVEYVQDINIVLDNLNAKIAALNIAQTISS